KDLLKDLGGKWNRSLNGWVFRKKDSDFVIQNIIENIFEFGEAKNVPEHPEQIESIITEIIDKELIEPTRLDEIEKVLKNTPEYNEGLSLDEFVYEELLMMIYFMDLDSIKKLCRTNKHYFDLCKSDYFQKEL